MQQSGATPLRLIRIVPGCSAQATAFAEVDGDPISIGYAHAIGDEVHHHAITYHRKLRAEGMMKSIFEDMPGIGPKRREALLEHFTSLEELRDASIEQIARVPGVGLLAAQTIKDQLAQQKPLEQYPSNP